MARLSSDAHDLPSLDEPTDHLSPGLVEELEEALAHRTGALVSVIHDRGVHSGFSGRHLRLEAGEIHDDKSTNRFVDILVST